MINWLTLKSQNISTGKRETKIDPENSAGLLLVATKIMFSWLQGDEQVISEEEHIEDKLMSE